MEGTKCAKLLIRRWSDSDDVGALTELLHRAYRKHLEANLNFVAATQPPEHTSRRIARGTCWIAEREQDIVGTAMLEGPGDDDPDDPPLYRDTSVCVLSQFAVEPRMQGTGIGKALLAKVESEAIRLGAATLALDTSEKATDLIRMYERWGFRFVAFHQWGGNVNYRSVVMSKSLVPPLQE